MVNTPKSWFPIVGLLAVVACADEAPPAEEAPAGAPAAAPPAMTMPMSSVTITEPAQGATVTGPNVRVAYSVTGLTIAPAGTMAPGTGHHHLFVDVDVTPLTAPIPAGTPGIIHLGMAQTDHMVEGLAPGPHRLIAVVADGTHTPLNPPVMDTVNITVAAP